MMYLKETCKVLRRYKIKLNPEKCVFKVTSGNFLGFIVSYRGIEANSEKIRAVIKIKSLRTLKDIQTLTRKLVALNRFISQATGKCHVFFKMMRNERKMKWTAECEEAFQQLK